MKKHLLLLAALLSVNFASAQVSNDNQDGVYKIDKHAQSYREGEIIVKFKASSQVRAKAVNGKVTSGVSAVDKVLSAIGANEVEELMPLSGSKNVGKRVKAYNGNTIVTQNTSKLYRMSFDKEKIGSVYQAIEAVKEVADVEYVEPNYFSLFFR